MSDITALTLEGVLADVEMEGDYPVIDLDEATQECVDIIEDILTLESNLVVLEAAAAIKKAKSKKKNLKIKTSKMSGKDAKELKKSGKKIKVKKVTKEDEEVDGGTGPQPTTTDTNGLTDDDVDALPDDVEVSVTEVTDSEATPEEVSVGTEGVDFVVEYECADFLVQCESNDQSTKKSIIQHIKELVKKIGQWIASAIAKIISIFRNDGKFFDNHKTEIEANMKTKELSMFDYDGSPASLADATIKEIEGVIEEGKVLDDANRENASYAAKLKAKLEKCKHLKAFKGKSEEGTDIFGTYLKGEKKRAAGRIPSKCGITSINDFKYFAKGEFAKKLGDVKSKWKQFESWVNKFADQVEKTVSAYDGIKSKEADRERARGEEVKTLRVTVSLCHQAVTRSFAAVSKLASTVMTVMHQLGGTKKEDGDK